MLLFYVSSLCVLHIISADVSPINDILEVTKPLYVTMEDMPEFTDDIRLLSETPKCGVRKSRHGGKIVGGINAEKGEFPWQVSLQLRTGMSLRHLCGGAVLNKYWIITAGHCVNDLSPKGISIVAGEHDLYILEGGEQRRNVTKIIMKNFDLASFSNDIALLKLEKPLKFYDDNRIAPICLPSAKDVFQGTAITSGWGRLQEDGDSPHILQHVSLPIIDKKDCEKKYKSNGFSYFLNKCQLCAATKSGGKDACQGDSGGPLVYLKNDQYYLCGLVSWGIGCARPQFPGVYTDVKCYLSWIKDTMEKE